MKAKIKHYVSQAASFIFDLVILVSGVGETIDIKKLVRDFSMYSYLLLLLLRNRLAKVFFHTGLSIVKYKTLFVCILFVPAGAAFMLHFTTVTIMILFVMIVVAGPFIKTEADDGFANGSLS